MRLKSDYKITVLLFHFFHHVFPFWSMLNFTCHVFSMPAKLVSLIAVQVTVSNSEFSLTVASPRSARIDFRDCPLDSDHLSLNVTWTFDIRIQHELT